MPICDSEEEFFSRRRSLRPLPKTRPDRPGQLDPEDFVPGLRIRLNPSGHVVTVESSPQTHESGATYVQIDDALRERIYLADNGVIPYASGVWNDANWIERA